ncbi:MAG: DRTGG domain-containing protein [Anaerolineae bacterium]
MQLHEILRILNGRIVNNTDNPELELTSGGAADLMSDVLAFTTDGNSLLFTGLTNQQVVRTAEMANVGAIVFVRGKQPPPSTTELADELHIPLIACDYSMYQACGLLYQAGLPNNRLADFRPEQP